MTEQMASIGGFDVFILAESRLVREALARVLRKRKRIRSVSAATLNVDALEDVVKASPQVVLLDPGGVLAVITPIIEQIKREVAGVKIVLVGMADDPQTFVRFVRLGIAGYLLEDASASDLALAVIAVTNEEAVCPPHLCLNLFEYVAHQGRRIPNLHARIKLGLTHREQELVEQISLGLSNKEIATKWNLAEQTVRNHVHRVLKKLGAPNRLIAADICQAEGFLV